MNKNIIALESMIEAMNKQLEAMKKDYYKNLHDWAMSQPDINEEDERNEAEMICRYENIQECCDIVDKMGNKLLNINYVDELLQNIWDKFIISAIDTYYVEITHDTLDIIVRGGGIYHYYRKPGFGWLNTCEWLGKPSKDLYAEVMRLIAHELNCEYQTLAYELYEDSVCISNESGYTETVCEDICCDEEDLPF